MMLTGYRPMELHWYLVKNFTDCTRCKVNKKLLAFYKKGDVELTTECNKCKKIVYKEFVMKSVMGVFTGF